MRPVSYETILLMPRQRIPIPWETIQTQVKRIHQLDDLYLYIKRAGLDKIKWEMLLRKKKEEYKQTGIWNGKGPRK